jgi:hypothetical protein
MSLYEVSDIVRGTSFRARALIRGGEPFLISERSATRAMKPWDRIAARVVQVESKTQICGGVLTFGHALSEGLTPRAAVQTDDERSEVVQWLKMMENQTAKSGACNSAMASYNFSWLWAELGISELRR